MVVGKNNKMVNHINYRMRVILQVQIWVRMLDSRKFVLKYKTIGHFAGLAHIHWSVQSI